MKLRAYHAGDGDCLLVTSGAGSRTLLVDGGRKGTFEADTLPDLTMKAIDVACVSHIDDDHISGILGLFEAEVEWRKHLFRKRSDPNDRPPRVQRPPRVKEVWHNALFELLGPDLVLPVENALATTSQILRARGHDDAALANENIALGERAGIELARRISPAQLDIELNRAAGGGLLTRGNAGRRSFHGMRVKVIGPSQDDIDRLRVVWRRWIDDHPSAIDELREALREDEEELGLARAAAAPVAAELGEGASKVTAPNLASLMLLLEEGGSPPAQSVLLTGDGAADEILQGLEETGELAPAPPDADLASLPASQTRHVTVFKVPHHGALANVTEALVHRITADHYVFCGNGAHHNPELEVLRRIAEVRRGGVGPASRFTFWFTSASGTPGLTKKRRDHMTSVEALVSGLIADSGGQLDARFMAGQGFLDVLP